MTTVITVSHQKGDSNTSFLSLFPFQYGDTTHTLVERTHYGGDHFLPGFVKVSADKTHCWPHCVCSPDVLNMSTMF